MKITVFNGSPKAKKSATHVMAAEFLKGAEEAGAETENVFLAQKKIRHCMGCFACWTKTPGKCAIKDDMAELLEKYLNSDLVVYACPVYYGSVTGLMKDFIDRTLPLADPHFAKTSEGIARHIARYEKYPDMAIISNCGFPEQTHFKYFRNIFNYMEDNDAAGFVAEIYRGGGPLLTTEVPELKPIIDNYKILLRKAGKEVVENGRLSDETRAEMEKPLIPADMYLEMGNRHWDKVLSKVGK